MPCCCHWIQHYTLFLVALLVLVLDLVSRINNNKYMLLKKYGFKCSVQSNKPTMQKRPSHNDTVG
eukprot:m.67806 g.67806  ORF g.67806 m.67806 type:complete len:65 (-) comp13650_c0_seq1:191-385(-)